MPEQQPRVLVDRQGPVLRIGLNRPDKRNAADRAMLRELAAAYTLLERDDSLRVGLVHAEGDHFTAGLDLADVGGDLAGGSIDFRDDDQLDPWGLSGPARTKPVVVAVHGTCLTLGIELMLAAAYTLLERDDSLRVGLVHAEGDHFTAGLDLADVGGDLAGGSIDFRDDDQLDPWGLSGPARTKPVVVAVHGTCLTLGIELILAADVAVATDTASFGQIEVARGILPFGGATARFPAAVGWGNAMRWMLTAERFDAAEALRIGLVQQVVPAGTELSAAGAIAERIAAQAPLAVSAVLAASRAARGTAEREGFAGLGGSLRDLAASQDAAEGVRAFRERRDPVWTGR